MRALVPLLGVLVGACSGDWTLEVSLTASGSDRASEPLGITEPRTILLGETLEVFAVRKREHGSLVSSDSPRVDYRDVKVAVRCKSTTNVACKVTGTTIEPLGGGTFRIDAKLDHDLHDWTINVVDPLRIEVKPCGTVTTSFPQGFIHTGVFAVGSDGTSVELNAPVFVDYTRSTFVSTKAPGQFRVHSSALGRETACTFTVAGPEDISGPEHK